MTEFTRLTLQGRKLRPEETKNYPVCHSESIGVRAQTHGPRKCLSWLGRSTEGGTERGGAGQVCKAHIRQCLLAHRPVPALSCDTWQEGY